MSILELPLVAYPESPPVNAMTDYSHLWTYLYSQDLRWSYGGIKGTSEGQWGFENSDDPRVLADRALDAGFCGIQVDTASFASGADAQKYIAALGYPDFASSSGRWVFFELGGFSAGEYVLEPVEGFSAMEADPDGRPYWWMTSAKGLLEVRGAPATMTALTVDLFAPPCGTTVAVEIDGDRTEINGESRIETSVQLDELGYAEVPIEVMTPSCTVKDDPRSFYVGLRAPHVSTE